MVPDSTAPTRIKATAVIYFVKPSLLKHKALVVSGKCVLMLFYLHHVTWCSLSLQSSSSFLLSDWLSRKSKLRGGGHVELTLFTMKLLQTTEFSPAASALEY